MAFDPNTDNIAITIPEFTLKKDTEGWFDSYNEPYIVSMAVDESGKATPAIDFNVMPFPKVQAGDKVEMIGDGHIVYGPKNPGKFVALSILVMECDDDVRETGKTVKELVESKALELGLKAVIVANPGPAAVLGILKELTSFVAGQLEKNKDDKLFRLEGSFLRDHACPYHINRLYTRSNRYIELKTKVIPLSASNGEGKSVETLVL